MKLIKNLMLVLLVFALSLSLFGCYSFQTAYEETFREDVLGDSGNRITANEVFHRIRTENNYSLTSKEENYISDVLEASNRPEEYLEEDKQQELIIKAREAIKKNSLFSSGDKLNEIQLKLTEMFPDEELRVFGYYIYFEYDRIRLSLVDPFNPENVDDYYYRENTRAWTKEQPVKLRAADKPLEDSISLSDINFSDISRIYGIINEKSKDIEGAELVEYIYLRMENGNYFWKALINGARSDYDLEVEHEGDIIIFKKL